MQRSSKKMRVVNIAIATLFALQAWAVGAAETITDFNQAIRYAVVNNPGVQAAYHNFKATGFDLRAAKGGYLPELDLSGEYGHSVRESPIFPEDSYYSDEVRVTITQMLFDGFFTHHLVGQATHEQRAAYFQLKQVSEETALEAARAYYDVLRYQGLVRLADDNLKEHLRIFEHVQKRAEAGISRGVDLEQANARVALAEFNLLQEVTNLHDVVARFQRVVTALPSETLSRPTLPEEQIPGTRTAALEKAYELSPVLQRAAASLKAAQSVTKQRKAPFMPQVDLRLRAEEGNDLEGILGDYREEAIELVFRYNLYNGGSDRAARKGALSREEEAYDLRIKACHDVRQNLVVAFNDIGSIKQRLVYLARNELSIEKARLAYRKQFDLGQRTLLDLLDSENEYFDVSRALVNAQNDLAIAKLRTISTMGVLAESAANEEGGELFKRVTVACPQETVPDMSAYYLRKESLLESLRKGLQTSYRMDVRFEFDSDKVNESYDKDLRDAAQYLTENPAIKGQIVGHTDSVGEDAYNLDLSKRRATSVLNVLINRYNIKPDRLVAIGKGEREPVADNSDRSGRARNRRVEFVPLK